MVQGKWLGLFLGVVRGMPLWRFLRIVLARPEASMLDVPGILRGMRFSQQAMWAEVSALDLTTAVPALQVPVLWFEESAHEPPFEEPAMFNRTMAEMVRPACLTPVGVA